MKILLAEDERISRRNLERKLRSWGHEVVAVENGVEAWKRLQTEVFSLVISDWMMPELDGPGLVRRIRDVKDSHYIYVILLTAKSDKEDVVAGLEAGADDFLSKPFDRNELRVRLRAGQRIIELERELAKHNKRMKNELEAGARYVRSLLPPHQEKPFQVEWRYIPSADLAGDTLGYHWLDDDHFAFYLLDVTDHGVDSALLSVTILNVLRSGALPNVDFQQPDQVLTALNQGFPMEDHGDRCFTLWYGVYQLSSSTLAWASGGHPPALLWSEGFDAIQELPIGGPLLGMMEWSQYSTHHCKISAGSRLCVYSDGVYEILQRDGQMWPYQDFVKYMQSVQGEPKPMDALLEHVRKLGGQENLEDDFSMLELCF